MDVLLEIYSKMSLLKQNDERMRSVIKTGRLVMPYYSYRGQEAIPAAICTLLRDSDTISMIYRGVHDMLAKGCPVDQLGAELVDLRSVSPWDVEAVVTSVAKTGAAVFVHEAVKKFGACAEIASTIHERLHGQLRAPVRRIDAKFAPVSFSNVLETTSLPAIADVEDAIRTLARVTA